MKKTIVILLLTIQASYTLAQNKEAAIWVFQDGNALDFNSGSATYVPNFSPHTTGSLQINTICNNDGSLLFYIHSAFNPPANIPNLYNQQHQPVPNFTTFYANGFPPEQSISIKVGSGNRDSIAIVSGSIYNVPIALFNKNLNNSTGGLVQNYNQVLSGLPSPVSVADANTSNIKIIFCRDNNPNNCVFKFYELDYNYNLTYLGDQTIGCNTLIPNLIFCWYSKSFTQ